MKKKLKEFEVPVCVTISSEFIVKAKNKKQALIEAKKLYKGWDKLPCPFVEVDWAEEFDILDWEEDG